MRLSTEKIAGGGDKERGRVRGFFSFGVGSYGF